MALVAKTGQPDDRPEYPTPASAKQIAEWMAILCRGDRVEVRAVGVERKADRSRHAETSVFRTDRESLLELARYARNLTARAEGVYFTLNPIADYDGKAAKDADVERRAWILFDLDPVRPADVSSTDHEKLASYQAAMSLRRSFDDLGWPEPILADSGNGWHLLYHVDLPADDKGLVAAVLKAVSARHSTELVKVDTTVGNASRICKLYGTLARKGEHTADRPHRCSWIMEAGWPLKAVPKSLLEAIAGEAGESSPKAAPARPAANAAAERPVLKVVSPRKGIVARDLGDSAEVAYGLRALGEEIDRIRFAAPGGRNHQLFKSAAALFELVAAGALGEGEVMEALKASARLAGLEPAEIEKTIDSARKKGIVNPRDMSHVGKPREAKRGEDGKLEIVITTQEHLVIDQAIQAIASEPMLFQRGRSLVTILAECRPKSRRSSITRPDGNMAIATLPSAQVRRLMTIWASWFKMLKTRNGDFEKIPSHPPTWAVDGVVTMGQWEAIRPLEGIIEAPTLRPDGSLLTAPGYDGETGLFYVPNDEFPPIPDRPTKEEVADSVKVLLDLIQDFPFAGVDHAQVWIAALLTSLARFAIDGPCPLFLFNANTPGTGKSKLCDLIAILATGRKMPRGDYPWSDEEMQKMLLSVAIAGDRFVLFDNVATGLAIGGPSLDRVLTADTLRGRILGKSEMTPELPFKAVLFASGNNLDLRGDALRRVVLSRLETVEEHPEERTDFAVDGDILVHAKKHRGRLVAAGLTILSGFVAAGRPRQDLPAMDYVSWSGLVREALHWATGVDPCETKRELVANDDEMNQARAILGGWEALCEHGNVEAMSIADALAELKELQDGHPKRFPAKVKPLEEVLVSWSRDGRLPTSRVVGAKFKQLRDRNIGGRQLRHSILEGIRMWHVYRISDR